MIPEAERRDGGAHEPVVIVDPREGERPSNQVVPLRLPIALRGHCSDVGVILSSVLAGGSAFLLSERLFAQRKVARAEPTTTHGQA